jgi:hypothetical protein
MTKIAGSGSISQRYGSADPDPDPHQNVMEPELWSHEMERLFWPGHLNLAQIRQAARFLKFSGAPLI